MKAFLPVRAVTFVGVDKSKYGSECDSTMTGFCGGGIGADVGSAIGEGVDVVTTGNAFFLLPLSELLPPFTKTETKKKMIK